MNYSSSSLRNDRDITCSSALRNDIDVHLSDYGLGFENFADILGLMGLQFPVSLLNYDSTTHSFECSTQSFKSYPMHFCRLEPDGLSILVVDCGFEINYYQISKSVSQLELLVQKRVRKKESDTLETYHYLNSNKCDLTLNFGNTHTLAISLELSGFTDNRELYDQISRVRGAMESFLLGLDLTSIDLNQIADVLQNFLWIHPDQLSISLEFSYSEKNDKEELTQTLISKLLKEKGIKTEYADTIDGTFKSVSIFGDWVHQSGTVLVSYSARNNCSKLIGSTDFIKGIVNLPDFMRSIKEEIEEFQKNLL